MLVVYMLWLRALARLWLRALAGIFFVLAGAVARTAGSSFAQAGTGWLAFPTSRPQPPLNLSVPTRRLRWTLINALLAARLWKAQQPLNVFRLLAFRTSRSVLLPPSHSVLMILMNRTLKLKKVILIILRAIKAKVTRTCHVKQWWVGYLLMHTFA